MLVMVRLVEQMVGVDTVYQHGLRREKETVMAQATFLAPGDPLELVHTTVFPVDSSLSLLTPYQS